MWVSIGKTTKDFATFKRDLLAEYGGKCQCRFQAKSLALKCKLEAIELDHCLIRKNKTFREWINGLVWNWQPACHVCNFTHATDTQFNREFWFEHVIEKYGYDRIRKDMDTAPEKMQLHNSDWLEVDRWLERMLQ